MSLIKRVRVSLSASNDRSKVIREVAGQSHSVFHMPRSLDHGDAVVALARSDTSADSAFDAANGHHIQVLRGDLSDPIILAKGDSELSGRIVIVTDCQLHPWGAQTDSLTPSSD